MAHYVVLGKYTEQGIRNIKEGPNRAKMVEQALQQAGGSMTSYYITMGEYDFLATVDLPNDETALRILMQIGQQGNVRTTTLKAFTRDEAAKILEGL